MYTLLQRIKRDVFLSEEEKRNYGNLLRSQLTTYELVLAAFNGLSPVSNDMDELIVHFHLLKYIPPGQRLRALKRYYPDKAFTARD